MLRKKIPRQPHQIFTSVVSVRWRGGICVLADAWACHTAATIWPRYSPPFLHVFFCMFLLSTEIEKILTIKCLMIFVLIFLLLLHHYMLNVQKYETEGK